LNLINLKVAPVTYQGKKMRKGILNYLLIAVFAIAIVFTSCDKKPEDKTFTYSANGNNWGKEDVKAALNNKNTGIVTVKSAEDFNKSEHKEMSEHAKELHEIFKLGKIRPAGTINALKITQGALDTLKAIGFNVTGDTFFVDTIIYFGFVRPLPVEEVEEILANLEIRKIILKSKQDWAGATTVHMAGYRMLEELIFGLDADRVISDTESILNPETINPEDQEYFEQYFRVIPGHPNAGKE